MTLSAIDPVDPIVQRLRMLVQDAPELKDAAHLYGAILPVLRDADLHVGTVSITSDQARAKMEMGLPLLHDLDLEFDGRAVSELMLKLVCSVEADEKKSAHPRRAAARRIRMELEKGALDVSGLVLHMADGEKDLVASAAASLRLDPGLVCTLMQNALKPALRAWCRQLIPVAGGDTLVQRPVFHMRRRRDVGRAARKQSGQTSALRTMRSGLGVPQVAVYVLRERRSQYARLFVY